MTAGQIKQRISRDGRVFPNNATIAMRSDDEPNKPREWSLLSQMSWPLLAGPRRARTQDAETKDKERKYYTAHRPIRLQRTSGQKVRNGSRDMGIGRTPEIVVSGYVGEKSRPYNRDWLFPRWVRRAQALDEGRLSERARRRAISVIQYFAL